MGHQLKIFLPILLVLAVAGLAGLGIRYATLEPTDAGGGEQQAAAPSQDAETADDSATGDDDRDSADRETAAADAIPPTFDLVRVEPSGEVVAAGRASRGARVELLLGDEVIARADANLAGEWALVFDEPLAPGSYDLLLRATGPDGTGDMVEGDRVTIVIEGEETPLVAVTRPDEPTEVLQSPADSEETVVAEAPSDQAADNPAPATASDDAASDDAPAVEQQLAASAPAAGAETASDAPAGGERATAQGDGGMPDESGSDDGTAGTAPRQDDDTAATSDTDGAGQETARSDTSEFPGQAAGGTASRDAPAQRPAVSDGSGDDGEPGPDADAGGDANVAIETVEVEDSDGLMLSGRADAGEAVRLYLNNEPLDDVESGADGRWELSMKHPMPPGRYELRADVVDRAGVVKGRAEVKFDRVMVVEAQNAPQDQDGDPDVAGGQDGTTPARAGGGASVQGSGVTIVSGASGGGAASHGGAVGEGAGASVVVIARGDSLWRIARKIYGQGVRHTVIFEANRNQIRNKHLIYPGQVFTIPVLEDDDNADG